MIIRNAMIYDAINKEPYQGDIAINQGKITAIGVNLPSQGEEIDATGYHAYPGFVEAHAHTGLDGYGIGFEGADYNEMGDVLSPQLRAIDAFQPFDRTLVEAKNAGVTTLCVGPGSANVLGGTFTVVKPVGKRIDDMYILKEAAMKCAFGENPKRCYREKGNCTRMTTAANLRDMLFKASEYDKKLKAAEEDPSKKPAFDMKLQALLPVVRGEMPLKAHAHQADDIFTALRIAKEFNVKITLEHCTEGHLVADELAAEKVPMAVGPTLGHATKFELRNKSWRTPDILARAGGQVSIITDAPVIPQKYLALCAGLAVKSGMDPFEALKAITINPAKHIGVDHRVGSIEVGKDADLVLTNGSPFSIETIVQKVLIDGNLVFENQGEMED